jgi:hypothetical protein
MIGHHPSFGISMDFLKRGGMHCLEGKEACTKHPDLCSNKFIFNKCAQECLIKRRHDAKTASIKRKLQECDEDFINESKYAGSILEEKGSPSHHHQHEVMDDSQADDEEEEMMRREERRRKSDENLKKYHETADKMRKKYSLDKK